MRLLSPQTQAFFDEAIPRWNKLQSDFIAAGLSYFALFSIAPLLILLITATGTLVAQPRMQAIVLEKVSIWVSPQATELMGEWMSKRTVEKKKAAMHPQLEAVQQAETRQKHSAILGLLLLAYGGSQALRQTRQILNLVWEEGPRKSSFLKDLFRSGLWNLAMLLALGLLMLSFFALDASLAFLWNFARGYLPLAMRENLIYLQAINFVASLFLIGFMLCLTYRYVPDARVEWQDVWAGAIVTAILLAIGKVSISVYLSLSGFQSLYGAASSLLVFLLSMYVAAHVFIIGAIVTRSWAELWGSRRPVKRR